jgi:hypothetical protein
MAKTIKKRYARRPDDVTFNETNAMGTLRKDKGVTLSIFDYPYDKGADARLIINYESEASHGLKYEGDNGIKMTCQIQDWICGFDYKDMRKLAAWATQAAKYLKDDEARRNSIDS